MHDKLKEAIEILTRLRLPKEATNKLSALTLLALCDIKPQDDWTHANRRSMTLSKDIMTFIDNFYGISYKANTRESIRKQAINTFVSYGLIELNPDNPDLPQTSPNTHYAATDSLLKAVRLFGTDRFDEAAETFRRLSRANFPEQINILLRNLHIRNFKSIADDKIELGQFNVFIGSNGCGKTNILEAIATVGADRAKDMTFEGLSTRGVRYAKPELLMSSFLGDSLNNHFDIELGFDVNGKGETYMCSLTPAAPNDPYSKWVNLAEEELYPQQLLNFFTEITRENPGISGDDLLTKANERISLDGLSPDRSFDNTIIDYAIFDLNTRALRGISSDSKKTPLGLNGEGIDMLIAGFSKEEIKQLTQCLEFFDWLHGIYADKEDKYKIHGLKPGRSNSKLYFEDSFMRETNNVLSAEISNEGVLHVLFYFALFISSKTPRLLGIDNIETALNPRLCRVMIQKLVQLAALHKKQVLVTTHNPAILDGLNLLDEEQRLFEVYRDSQGHTKTRRVRFKPDLSDKKYKLSDLWLKGIIGAPPQNF